MRHPQFSFLLRRTLHFALALLLLPGFAKNFGFEGLLRCQAAPALQTLLFVSGSQGDGPLPPVPDPVSLSLDGSWEVSLDNGENFQNIEIPSTIEDAIDVHFDGKSIYRRKMDARKWVDGRSYQLEFDAVATHARVYFQNEKVAEHLGGWTPFSADITDAVRRHQSASQWELRVEVDELVGHNTQGFLPVIIPHFGGIWQSVRYVERADVWIDKTTAMAIGNWATRTLHVEIPLCGYTGQPETHLTVHIRPWKFPGERSTEWRSVGTVSNEQITQAFSQQIPGKWLKQPVRVVTAIPVDNIDVWAPDSPTLYEVKLQLWRGSVPTADAMLRCGFRNVEVDGSQLQLNGHPLVVRGLLNWGYAPPGIAPSLNEAWMRDEIEFARQRGFNLMKFCLWVPPKRYLELCDELGMLAWMEYPTWHPKLDEEHLDELRKEYDEFFFYDRNHPSVILRSLTCETGPSADIRVLTSLYEQCKQRIPGAIVEDDSSWISWNRVHDFYDDHPYGNNHTWIAVLNRLKTYISQRESKPLILGEAIAADTWVNPLNFLSRTTDSNAAHSSVHSPWFLDSNAAWLEQMEELAESQGLEFYRDRLASESLHYAMLMRKFQIEAYRREVPDGGYVVSVIRDFPKASMGLIDYHNHPKTAPQEWSFQHDIMLLLETPDDRRSCLSGENFQLRLHLTNSSPDRVPAGDLTLQLVDNNAAEVAKVKVHSVPAIDPGKRINPAVVEFPIPSVQMPERFEVVGTWNAGSQSYSNSWPIWVIPQIDLSEPSMRVHGSAAQWSKEMGIRTSQDASEDDESVITIAQRLDPDLLLRLELGARVLLVPDGLAGSFPIQDHWFLRGGPAIFRDSSREWMDSRVPVEFYTELQHFDLAGPVIPNLHHHMDRVVPLLVLWDNHDLRETRSHGLAFEMLVGKGRLLVTSLNFASPAGKWVLEAMLRDLARSSDGETVSPTAASNFQRLQEELHRQEVPLNERPWRFQTDPDARGVADGWYSENWIDEDWANIRVDRHWEGQGYPELDHWAWYRLNVVLPDDWNSAHTYLNFEGVDDYFDVYVNGHQIGSGGNIERRETAFELRKSFEITSHAEPGAELCIAVAVYDWYGAGGIFRPVTITTMPLSEEPPLLR